MSETYLITTFSSRLHFDPLILQTQLVDLDPQKLMSLLRTEFYDSRVMEVALCIFFAIFARSTSKVPPEERIKYWFRDLHQIGQESLDGYAMESSLRQVSDSLVLKAARDQSSDLIHELFIGLYGTNRLRMTSSNFAYLFGGFHCSAPIIEPRMGQDTVKVLSYCDQGPQVPYIIYENIAPGEPMSSFLKHCTADEFIKVYMQLVLALALAYREIGFCHNDLHYGNVIIRDLGREYSFPYLTPDGKKYITTRYLPVIIDFNRSRITYQGKSYGSKGLENYGIFPDIPLPYLDLYKILYFSLLITEESNNQVYQEIKFLAPFFTPSLNPEEPSFDSDLFYDINLGQDDAYSVLDLPTSQDRANFKIDYKIKKSKNPLWTQVISFTHEALYRYIKTKFDTSFLESTPSTSIAGSESKKDYQAILDSVFVHPQGNPGIPQDLFEVYDVITQEGGNNLNLTQGRYQKYRDEFIQGVNNLCEEIKISISQIDPNYRLSNRVDLKLYIDRFYTIIRIKSMMDQLPFLFELGYNLGDLYDDKILYNRMYQLNAELVPYQTTLDNVLEELILDQANVEPGRRSADPDLNWLFTIFPKIVIYG